MAGNVNTIKSQSICTKFITTVVQGKEITAQLSLMEEGIDLLITGGDKSHIGAVEIANPDGKLFCVNFPTHKDDVIAGKWCRELWNRYKVQTVVSVGIHYDAATRELIEEILNKTDKMMEELLNG